MKTIIVIAAIFAIALAQQDARIVHEDPLNIHSDFEGGFGYAFEADNGIEVYAQGGAEHSVAGNFRYTSPEGEKIYLKYVANGDIGFVPTGDHLPVAPEIPPQIQRALEYIAAHPPTDPAQGAYVPDV